MLVSLHTQQPLGIRFAQVDDAASERLLLQLQAFLRRASKVFADRLPAQPATLSELVPEVPSGTVCVQWYSSGEQMNMLYVLHNPEDGAADGFRLGQVALPLAQLLRAADLLATASHKIEMGPGAAATSGDVTSATAIDAVRDLLQKANEGNPPEPIEEPIDDSCHKPLSELFKPSTGASVVNETLCTWLRKLLPA